MDEVIDPMAWRLRSWRGKSKAWKRKSPNSLLYFRTRTLGDKLQRLARVSPSHLGVIELLVDQILKRLEG